MTKNTFVGLVVLCILIVGGLLWWANTKQAPLPAPVTADTAVNTETATSTESTPSAPVMITYTTAGFSPANVTIKKGDTVTWTNESGGNMWVASNIHPSHMDYDGTTLKEHCAQKTATTFDECGSGTSFTFTFSKAGSWSYHNHAVARHSGVITVTE